MSPQPAVVEPDASAHTGRRGVSSSRNGGGAGAAEVAVVVLGEWQNVIGEAASRSSLELPGRQLELLHCLKSGTARLVE